MSNILDLADSISMIRINETMNEDNMNEDNMNEDNIDYNLINDMDNLSLKNLPDFTKDSIMIDLFQNNLDVYEKKICLDIPNIYCNKYYDDEDFIYAKLKLPIKIINIINNTLNGNGISEYFMDYIINHNIDVNYNNIETDSNIIYSKIIYIYQFVNYYYKDLKCLPPQERIKHLPFDLLIWVDNITMILRNTIDSYSKYINNIDSINDNNSKAINIFQLSKNIKDDYINELIYGLNLTVCHLKMILNHYRISNIHFLDMEVSHINKFFKILNNLCAIIIFIKLY